MEPCFAGEKRRQSLHSPEEIRERIAYLLTSIERQRAERGIRSAPTGG